MCVWLLAVLSLNSDGKSKNSQAIISSPGNGHHLMQMAKWRGFREQAGGGKSKRAEFSADRTPHGNTTATRNVDGQPVSSSSASKSPSRAPSYFRMFLRTVIFVNMWGLTVSVKALSRSTRTLAHLSGTLGGFFRNLCIFVLVVFCPFDM